MEIKTVSNLLLFVLFLYAALGTLLSYGLNKNKWLFFTKPFIMPSILLYYIVNTNSVSLLLIAAFFFAFMGDSFLMWHKRQLYFIAGLLSFLLMQVLYFLFIIFHQLKFPDWGSETLVMIFVYVILCIAVFSLLYRYLGRFKLPVLFYIMALLSVSYFCFLNVVEHKTEIAFWQYLGSLLFIVSDTILAIDNFRKPLRYAGIFIMLTYILAQVFLVTGFMNT